MTKIVWTPDKQNLISTVNATNEKRIYNYKEKSVQFLKC